MKVSIVIPIHRMERGDFFFWRCIQSVVMQDYKDYEIVITQEGSMPVNSNAGINKATGDLIKLMYMDDFFAHPKALSDIVNNIGDGKWLVTGCLHQKDEGELYGIHTPKYTDDIYTGNNCIGSPTVLTMRRGDHLLFDERLSWLLDCDLYKRLHDLHGPPVIVNSPNVVIGIHDGQTSFLMSNEEKQRETLYLITKYV